MDSNFLTRAAVRVGWPEFVACWIVGGACVALGLSFVIAVCLAIFG